MWQVVATTKRDSSVLFFRQRGNALKSLKAQETYKQKQKVRVLTLPESKTNTDHGVLNQQQPFHRRDDEFQVKVLATATAIIWVYCTCYYSGAGDVDE